MWRTYLLVLDNSIVTIGWIDSKYVLLWYLLEFTEGMKTEAVEGIHRWLEVKPSQRGFGASEKVRLDESDSRLSPRGPANDVFMYFVQNLLLLDWKRRRVCPWPYDHAYDEQVKGARSHTSRLGQLRHRTPSSEVDRALAMRVILMPSVNKQIIHKSQI